MGNSTPTLEGPNQNSTGEITPSKTEQNIADFFEMVLKVLYLLLWPLLAIAGASLDNTLVYGEIFYLDKALWEFWQMIRTFANFWLGFIFIASIFMSFIGAEKAAEKISVKTIIKKLFLAWILINMSWFIVAALIDLSTVMVFSLGALPLNVVRDDVALNQWLWKVRYLTTHSFYNQDSSTNTKRDLLEHSVIYSCPGEWYDPSAETNSSQRTYYLPCWIENGKFVDTESVKENNSRENYKQKYIDARGEIWNGDIGWNISDDYCVWWYDLIEQVPWGQFSPDILPALRENGLIELKNKKCSTLDTLIEKAQWMTWPLYTLFATIMHMGEIGLTVNNKTVVEKWLEFLMRTIVGIALFLPLFAFAVVLVMRAVILWLIIAFSPLLTLIYVFNFQALKVSKAEFNLKNVVGLIFLPVYGVFAVSITIIFLSLIGRIDLIDDTNPCKADAYSETSWTEVTCPEKNTTCYKMFDITEICFTESQRNTWSNIVNTLSWLTVNFFGIALMRTIIFFVLKSDKITWSIAGKIEWFGKSLAWSASVIPLPAWGFTSFSALKQSASDVQKIPDKISQQQYRDGIGEYIESYGARGNAKQVEKLLAEKVTKAKNGEAVSYSTQNFVLPDNTNHSQFASLWPSLWLAAGKSYADAKWMDFKWAYSDPQTINYMQANGMYNTESWVKNDGSMGRSEKVKLARQMEQQLASAGGKSLGADSANPTSTWYVLGDYVTQFPWADSAKWALADDLKPTKIVATPTKKDHWDEFNNFFRANVGVRNNPEFTSAFANYMTVIRAAADTGTDQTWVDRTNAASPVNYKIRATKNAANEILQFTVNL